MFQYRKYYTERWIMFIVIKFYFLIEILFIKATFYQQIEYIIILLVYETFKTIDLVKNNSDSIF